jgi:hypothetical protein
MAFGRIASWQRQLITFPSSGNMAVPLQRRTSVLPEERTDGKFTAKEK